MQLVRRIVLLSLMSIAVLCMSASPGLAEDTPALAKWDQERATMIADELSTEAKKLRQVVRKAFGGAQIGSGAAQSRYRLRDLLRLIENETRYLRRQLENGKNREETMPVYRRLMTTILDARENARRTYLSQDILAQADKMRDALMRLSAYYDPNANANPNIEAEAAKSQSD